MANQKTVKIVNPKRSISNEKKFEAEMYETLWLKKEADLRAKGWLLGSEIKEVVYEKVDDGKGIKTVNTEVEELVTEKEIEVSTKSIDEMNLSELKAECEARGLKFHHASKKKKLIELLTA
jgi:hypothetical protein